MATPESPRISTHQRWGLVAALLVATTTTAARPAMAADPVPSLSTLLAIEDPTAPSDTLEAQHRATLNAQPTPNAPAEEIPVTSKWWFWALTGVVVVGTVGLVVWASQPTETPAKPCSAGTISCFGDGR